MTDAIPAEPSDAKFLFDVIAALEQRLRLCATPTTRETGLALVDNSPNVWEIEDPDQFIVFIVPELPFYVGDRWIKLELFVAVKSSDGPEMRRRWRWTTTRQDVDQVCDEAAKFIQSLSK